MSYLGLVWLGLAWFGLVGLGLVWFYWIGLFWISLGQSYVQTSATMVTSVLTGGLLAEADSVFQQNSAWRKLFFPLCCEPAV